jgi:Tfp pilus assembly protein PilX
MAKATKKRTAGKPSKAGSRHSRKKSTSVRKAAEQAERRPNTKQSRAIAMLRSTKGASLDALMEATGWQQHSVRGFLAGVIRKRLGLDLESSKMDGSRVYRITGESSARPNSAAVDP